LEKSAVLNDAYRTLREPVARAEYLLGLEGARREGEIRQEAPPELLAEVFELNEYLEELRAAKRSGSDARELAELRHQLEGARETFRLQLEQLMTEFETAFREWDTWLEANGDVDARRAALEKMSSLLNRHSYLRNLVSNVTDELEEP
jgi:molecular chaperone HscB